VRTLISPRLLPFLGLLLLGCASAAPVKCPDPLSPGSRRVLGDELIATREPDLYQAIVVSRPTFLQPRDARRQHPAVYVDGIAMAEFDALRSVPLADVVEVAFMSGPDATTRYGTGHVGGAILVRTTRGLAPGRCGG